MKKLIIGSLIASSLFLPTTILADSSCGSIYGGNCANPNFTINKTVKNPVNGEFVDNLSANSPHFLPDQTINFRLHVQNTGNTDLNNVQVQDRLPNYIDFISGPGSFDKNSTTLTFTVDNLKQGEFRDYDVAAKIQPTSAIPTNGISCVTNFAQATMSNQISSDTSVFCIESQVMAPVQQLPKTGPKETGLLLSASIIMLLASVFLYRKARA